MTLHFTKMQGLGNDFVVIDAIKQKVKLTITDIQKLADRHLGIGCDQLLLIEVSPSKQFDFIYRIFNANGEEVEQCGNGARCVGHYIFSERLSDKKSITLKTIGGSLELKQEIDGRITVKMPVPEFLPEKIPFIAEKQAPFYQLNFKAETIQFGAVSMGNPHVVIPVKDARTARAQDIGHFFQHHPAFPKQVNVGFMEIVSADFIKLRVYERGVGETKSCGSGACAAMAVGRILQELGPQVKVELPGGHLSVFWSSFNDAIYLTGPAECVFKGEIELSME